MGFSRQRRVHAAHTFAGSKWLIPLMVCGIAGAAGSVAGVQKLKNDKVVAEEFTLRPGETAAVDGRYPSVDVYFSGDSREFTPHSGSPQKSAVKRGETVFHAAAAGAIKNTGGAELKFVRVSFLTPGSNETWGAAGLSPNYKLLFENRYTRTYDIRIPAGGREPQHTHKARVVVCLSGAVLKHLMPDGREEPSTLHDGEVAWRLGGTHIGQNLGKTDLWVIAVEPK